MRPSRTSSGSRRCRDTNLDHDNPQICGDRASDGEDKTSTQEIRAPVPLRVRSFDHNLDRASIPPNPRPSVSSRCIFLPLRSPQENSEDGEDTKQPRLMYPVTRRPRHLSLKMRARGITYPTTKDYLQQISCPSPTSQFDCEANRETFESTVFGTPKQLSADDYKWSPPAPPASCKSDEPGREDFPSSVLLPLFD